MTFNPVPTTYAVGQRSSVKRVITWASMAATVLALIMAGAWNAASASASPTDPNFGHKVTLCHGTGSASNPFVTITVDVAASGLQGGHANHGNDIIPSFTYVDNQNVTHTYAGKNLSTMYSGATGSAVLANGCKVPDTPPQTDMCPNIDGIQESVPTGYHLDDAGNCVEDETPPGPTDVCPNIDGDQASLPDGYHLDDAGNCIQDEPGATDLCPNIDGTQLAIPTGYHLNDAGDCVVDETPTAGESATPTGTAGVTAGTTTTTTTTTTGGQGQLPFTGFDEQWLLGLGAALITAGLALLRIAQRRVAE